MKFAAIVEKENGKESTTEAAITYEDKKKNLTSINTESDKLLNLVTELRWSVLINEISSEFVR